MLTDASLTPLRPLGCLLIPTQKDKPRCYRKLISPSREVLTLTGKKCKYINF